MTSNRLGLKFRIKSSPEQRAVRPSRLQDLETALCQNCCFIIDTRTVDDRLPPEFAYKGRNALRGKMGPEVAPRYIESRTGLKIAAAARDPP